MNSSRRSFLKTTIAGASGLIFVDAAAVRGSQVNSAVTFGIIGSGNRAANVGAIFAQRPDVRFTAICDLYADKLQATREKFKVEAAHSYQGFDSYRKLLAEPVDAVLITTPAYYHPEHFAAAVEAKKHCYLEKPVGVDAPGCRSVINSGDKAQGKVSVVVGLQRRYSEAYQQAAKRVHDGALGIISSGRAQWLGADLRRKPREPEWSELEFQVRNWFFYKWLSGDIIIEQNVHNLDVINWFLNAHPVKAVAMTGRRARTDVGDVNDHFNVLYEYPGGIHVSFQSTQFQKDWRDVSEQLFGSKGTVDMNTGTITGDNKWKFEAPVGGNNEHVKAAAAAFIESIRSGKYLNDAPRSAESTLTGVLARTAAYKGREVTWDEVYNSKERLLPPKGLA